MRHRERKDVVTVDRRPVPLPEIVKTRLRRSEATLELWTGYRARQVEREYRARREHYRKLAEERGLVYSEARTTSEVRERLRARGYTPPPRKRGEVHTFAWIPSYSWHHHLLPDLRELGPVSHFDYFAHGFSVEELCKPSRKAAMLRDRMFELALPAFRRAHAERPVDWIFCYGGGQDIAPHVIREITEQTGVPTVCMSLDDKQGWAGASASPWRAGSADITSSFDLFATSARVPCEWHMVQGGRPLYMLEGFDASAFKPREVARDIDVSFVGFANGMRISIMKSLHRYGVDVRTFGREWPGSSHVDDSVEIFNRTRINLGIGGVEYSESLTNVKGRDFEIPGTGGGVYLTSFNSDLAQAFEIGREILCYRSRDEMLELIRYYLDHPEESEAIARAGRERSLREHRWLHRYEKMLRILGVLDDGR